MPRSRIHILIAAGFLSRLPRYKPVLRRKLRRKEMMAFFQRLGPTVVGIEACGGAHHWARVLQEYGHQVKLLRRNTPRPTSSAARTMPRTPRRCARR
jgi:transposase